MLCLGPSKKWYWSNKTLYFDCDKWSLFCIFTNICHSVKLPEYGFFLARFFPCNLQFSPSSGKYKPEKTYILAYFMQRAHKSLHVNLETLQSKKIWHFMTMLSFLVLLCFKVFILPKTKQQNLQNLSFCP